MNTIALKSFLLISVAILLGAFLYSKAFKEPRVYRWCLLWLLPTGVLAVTTNIWLLYITVVMVCARMVPKTPEDRVFYFVLLLPALPDLLFVVPFPGINYLFEISYPRMLVMCLLLPVYFSIKHKKSDYYRSFSYIDYLVVFFCIITTVLDFRIESSVTYWGRMCFYKFIDIWVPYYVVSRVVKDFRSILSALAFSGVLLAVLAVIEWRMTWKAYAILAGQTPGVKVSSLLLRNQYRGIGLRVSGSWLEPISFGFFMALTSFLVYRADLWRNKKNIFAWGVLAIALFALLLTDSRAGVIMLILSIAMVMYFGSQSAARKVLMSIGALVGIAFLYTKSDSLLDGDENGTFQYRYNLLINSADAISQNPIWGTPFFRSNQVLIDTMTQGQGIIDIVNTYLGILLLYGLAGLVPFVLIIIFLIKHTLATLNRYDAEADMFKAGVVLLCLVASASVLIFTTSIISYLPYYLWLLFAFSVAYIHLAPRKKS